LATCLIIIRSLPTLPSAPLPVFSGGCFSTTTTTADHSNSSLFRSLEGVNPVYKSLKNNRARLLSFCLHTSMKRKDLEQLAKEIRLFIRGRIPQR
jgi:hypothetical protein